MSFKKKILIWLIGFVVTVVVSVVVILVVVEKTSHSNTKENQTSSQTIVAGDSNIHNDGANSMHGNIYSSGFGR